MRLGPDLVDENWAGWDKKTYVWISTLKVATLKTKMNVYHRCTAVRKQRKL